MKCPSCGAAVPSGETICLDCGTELVFQMEGAPVPLPEPPAEEPAAPATPPSATIPCPDCTETVTPDANGMCPICGHEFGERVSVDESTFFADPPSLEQAMDAERKRLAELKARAAGGGASFGQPSPAQPLPGDSAPAEEVPLPGDKRARYADTGSIPAFVESARLEVEGGQTVFFDGGMTARISLDVDELLIGRRDPSGGHYPDIDLAHFREIDGHISRRHARVFRRRGRWFIEDLCENDATYVNDKAHVLNGETVPLHDGDRVLISDSVAMVLRTSGAAR